MNIDLKEQAHGEIERIFRILLPQNGLAVREEQIALCHAGRHHRRVHPILISYLFRAIPHRKVGAILPEEI